MFKKVICSLGCIVIFTLVFGIAGCAGFQRLGKRVLVFEDDFEDGDLNGWEATDERAWRIEDVKGGKALSLFGKSQYKPPVRSPFNINLIHDVYVDNFVMELKMLSTTKDYAHRDLCLFFGYQDASHFYYVHIANQSDAHANSIFIVDGKDRLSIAQQRTDGTKWDDNWHTVRLLRNIYKGTIKVYFDDSKVPIMSASDKRLNWGQVGVGSFDDTGKFDDLKIWSVD